MPRPRKGEQISVRVPEFAKDALDALPDAVVAASPADKRPSGPELVAALLTSLQAKTVAQAVRAYRRDLAKRGMADFHR